MEAREIQAISEVIDRLEAGNITARVETNTHIITASRSEDGREMKVVVKTRG